jgi:hypothetical protein
LIASNNGNKQNIMKMTNKKWQKHYLMSLGDTQCPPTCFLCCSTPSMLFDVPNMFFRFSNYCLNT